MPGSGPHAALPDDEWRRRFLACRQADLAALDRLAANLHDHPPPPGEPDHAARPGSLVDGLDALAELLAGSDLAALELHQALRPQLPAETATDLDDAMSLLDFPHALALCRRIRATLEPRP